jgi:hypothetical protein
MAKLKKREIIILVIAALFVLYAGYEYLIAGPASKKVKTTASADSVKVDTFTTGITKDLGKDNIANLDAYVISRMETDWKKNPFLKKDLYKAWVNREGVAKDSGVLAKIIYSGYVDSGKNKMAVINGFEYRLGEELEIEGYVLKQILPSKVLIFNKNTGNTEEIPLQE